MTELLARQFVGVHELRKNLPRLLDALREEGREVVITRQGKPAAIIVDVEKYLEVQQALEELSDPAYVASLLEARQEMRRGEGTPVEEVFRRKGL